MIIRRDKMQELPLSANLRRTGGGSLTTLTLISILGA
jgi:hypothetical protein